METLPFVFTMTFKSIFLTHLLLFWVGSVSKASDAAERSARDSDVLDIPLDALTATDALAQHMFKLYEKYSVELNGLKDGNTVRSFKAKTGEYAVDMYIYPLLTFCNEYCKSYFASYEMTACLKYVCNISLTCFLLPV